MNQQSIALPKLPCLNVIENTAQNTCDYAASKSRILKKYGSKENILAECRKHLDEFADIFNREYYEAFTLECKNRLFPNLFNLIHTIEEEPGILSSLKQNIEKYPHVFLPNHDSNLDALVHGIFFYTNRLGPPKTTAGSNLCRDDKGVFINQVIAQLKALNALIVDRQLLSRDILYIRLFREYLIQTLKNIQHHCFYIESGRSYEGRLKKEMTSAMLSWCLEVPVKKLALVPLSVSYSKCFDASDLYKCFVQNQKMPSTNLLDEFKKGAQSLGTQFPIIIRVGKPIMLSPGKDTGEVEDEAANEVAVECAGKISGKGAGKLASKMAGEGAGKGASKMAGEGAGKGAEKGAEKVSSQGGFFLTPNEQEYQQIPACSCLTNVKAVSKCLHFMIFKKIESLRPIFAHYILCAALKGIFNDFPASLDFPAAFVNKSINEKELEKGFGIILNRCPDTCDIFCISCPAKPLDPRIDPIFRHALDDLARLELIEKGSREKIVVKDPWACMFYSNKICF